MTVAKANHKRQDIASPFIRKNYALLAIAGLRKQTTVPHSR